MIALQQPDLIERVQRLAQLTHQDTAQVVETAVETYLDQLERAKLHNETEAFWAMQADLVANYPGEYVAIHQGQVIDHDPDVLRLEERVAVSLGNLAVLIAPVTTAPRRDLLLVNVRQEGAQGGV